VINLGNHRTVSLMEMIATLEEALGCKAKVIRQPEQPGDVPITCADVAKAGNLLGYHPQFPFAAGIREFVAWLRRGASASAATAP
jgi:UDP-glucuronate 4-epimerase